MAPLVVREGIPKTHIVMRGDVGYYLTDDEESQWRFGLHTFVQQLAHVSCMQVFDEALPGVLLSEIPDAYAAFLYPCIEAAWQGYFSSRASASFYPAAGQGYTEILISVLRHAKKDIPEARFNYHLDGNMDRLMSIVMPMINNVLRFSAKVLGHCDGLGQPLAQDQNLADELEQAGLRSWLILFDGELSELWNRRGEWASFDEFLHLNRHVERLFWQFRMIPWKLDDDKIWVEVVADVETQQMLTRKTTGE
jgi:hypothetical protein